ncbi:unnamed protein product [Lampetra fluviatilis]
MATPEEGGEVLSAEQHTDPERDSSPPSGKKCRTAHSCLAELLQAAVSIVAELQREEPAVDWEGTDPCGNKVSAAISR